MALDMGLNSGRGSEGEMDVAGVSTLLDSTEVTLSTLRGRGAVTTSSMLPTASANEASTVVTIAGTPTAAPTVRAGAATWPGRDAPRPPSASGERPAAT